MFDSKTGTYRRLNDANAFQDAPLWSEDGNILYYVQHEGDAMVLMSADPRTGRAEKIPNARVPIPETMGYYGQMDWNGLLAQRPRATPTP